MLRTSILLWGLLCPLAALAQPVIPGVPLGQPGPQDSDILRRSQRDLTTAPPAPVVAPGVGSGVVGSGPVVSQPGAGSLSGLVQPDGRIVVTREMCAQASIEHHPAPDVTYRPETDAYGRQVAPADLPGSGVNQYGLGNRTSTDILITPQTGGSLPQRGAVGETFVGRVTVDANGRAWINGHPVDSQGQSELQQLCARAGY
jgi:hypothetical protein